MEFGGTRQNKHGKYESNATPSFAAFHDHGTQTVPTPVALRRMLFRVPTPIAASALVLV